MNQLEKFGKDMEANREAILEAQEEQRAQSRKMKVYTFKEGNFKIFRVIVGIAFVLGWILLQVNSSPAWSIWIIAGLTIVVMTVSDFALGFNEHVLTKGEYNEIGYRGRKEVLQMEREQELEALAKKQIELEREAKSIEAKLNNTK